MLRLTKNYIHCRKITWQWNVDCLKVIGNGRKWAFPCQFYQQVDDLISNPQLSRIVLDARVHEAQPCGGLVGGEQSTWGTGHRHEQENVAPHRGAFWERKCLTWNHHIRPYNSPRRVWHLGVSKAEDMVVPAPAPAVAPSPMGSSIPRGRKGPRGL